MKLPQKFAAILAAIATTLTVSSPVQAIDEVNVAFFLEWATPNMIAKVEKAYDEAMGVQVNWINFDSGATITEAMLAGEIDIAFSQGLSPFIVAVNANVPITAVGVAVLFPAHPCFTRSGLGITTDNASELIGKTVALPRATMSDYSFRLQMQALDIDINQINIVDQVPATAVESLVNGSVDAACVYGGESVDKASQAGDLLMTASEMQKLGIISFDIVSVTDAFAKTHPELVRAFMDVTNKANSEFEAKATEIEKIARESGMDEKTTAQQMKNSQYPTNQQQLADYFKDGGLASQAFTVVGEAFATDEYPALQDYSSVIDISFLK